MLLFLIFQIGLWKQKAFWREKVKIFLVSHVNKSLKKKPTTCKYEYNLLDVYPVMNLSIEGLNIKNKQTKQTAALH